jgi:hypothetical protein
MSDIDFADFKVHVAEALDISPARLEGSSRPAASLGPDELSWMGLILAILELNPSFHIPEQADIHDLTLADLHHLCSTMTPDHAPSRPRHQPTATARGQRAG